MPKLKKLKVQEPVKEVEIKIESPVGKKFQPTGRFEVAKFKEGYQVVSPIGQVVSNHVDPELSPEDNHRKAVNFQEASNKFVRDSVHPDVWKKACERAKDQGLL